MRLDQPASRLILAATMLLALFLTSVFGSIHAQGIPGIAKNRCLAGKTKCVKKKIAGLLTCREKCQKNPKKCGDAQAKCETKVMEKFNGGTNPLKGCFAKLEAKDVPGAKPDRICTTRGDATAIETEVDAIAADLVATLEGNPPPACGDGLANGNDSCDGDDFDGATCASLGYASGTLACTAGCGYDVSGCTPHLSDDCGNGVIDASEQCDGADLGGATCASLGYTLGGMLACDAGCGYDTSGCASQAFPATGQMTCWDGDGNVVPCAGTGQDGDVQAGTPLAYQDNGDGTITDLNTGLMWAKKADDGSLHDWDNCYRWSGVCSGDGSTRCGRDADCAGVGGTCDIDDCQTAAPNGLTIFEWVDALNGMSFAGHTDWRLPNIREFHSIVNYDLFAPAASRVFDADCAPGCDVGACSCTHLSQHWSTTSNEDDPAFAWYVDFEYGFVSFGDKMFAYRVRAVRGGFLIDHSAARVREERCVAVSARSNHLWSRRDAARVR